MTLVRRERATGQSILIADCPFGDRSMRLLMRNMQGTKAATKVAREAATQAREK
jgi:hypothetical protein